MNHEQNKKVRIIDKKEGHSFKIGEIVTILVVDSLDESYYVTNGSRGGFVIEEEVESIKK